uniref:Uncharacterized protein n=1 Tax=uncultured marine virus TaxID=186617 RepID=A0A0F7L6B4_9VIRU|nr:hypothetical protein [uncultured marine virus]
MRPSRRRRPREGQGDRAGSCQSTRQTSTAGTPEPSPCASRTRATLLSVELTG